MKKNIYVILTIGLLLLSSLIISPVSSEDAISATSGITIYVDDDFNETTPGWNITNFSKIGEAIDAANENDTIFVYNGEYNENVVINKSINLTGENNEQTVISSGSNEDTIRVLADIVEISNFKIIAEGSFGQSINLFENGNSKIFNNNLESDWVGINLFFSSYNEILENYFNKCSVPIHYSNNNKISYNTFNGDGLAIVGSNYNEVSYNTIKSTDTGILTDSVCKNNIITYNIIEDCDFGINVGGGDENTISYNDFISNKYLDAWIFSSGCTWSHNYWGRPRILPKIIFGIGPPSIFIDFDMRPALTPNCNFGE